MADLAEEVRTQPSASNWRKLGSTILARLICFNKRRGGEMGRMLIATYEEVLEDPAKYKLQEEIYNSLSPMEQALSKSLLLVNIIGTLPYFCGLFQSKLNLRSGSYLNAVINKKKLIRQCIHDYNRQARSPRPLPYSPGLA